MTARFRIRRVPIGAEIASRAWVLHDRERPYRFTYHVTMPEAVAAVSARLRKEAGLPPVLDLENDEIADRIRRRREARKTFARHENAPRIIEPYGFTK